MDTLKLNISEPIALDQELEFKKLNVTVGLNGTGKSFVHICVWCGTIILNLIKTGKSDIKQTTQYVFDKSFTDQNINGTIMMTRGKEFINIEFQKGVVHHVSFHEEGPIVNINYLSNAMRTFDSIGTYLTTRKLLGRDRMDEAFKLYDVMYLESLILRCPWELPEKTRVAINEMGIKDDLVKLEVDLDKCDFYVTDKKGNKISCKKYSAGDQSILNICMANY